jgi:hypothetical protein
MINSLELDFATIRIYDNLIVSECKEGVLLDVQKNREVLALAEEVFNNGIFGYISHRINSYAVDPMVYRESAVHPRLKAIAVVSGNELARNSAKLEQQFYTNKNSFQIFSSLEEAKAWISTVLENQSIEKSANL